MKKLKQLVAVLLDFIDSCGEVILRENGIDVEQHKRRQHEKR